MRCQQAEGQNEFEELHIEEVDSNDSTIGIGRVNQKGGLQTPKKSRVSSIYHRDPETSK
jgi:hypothetical protein